MKRIVVLVFALFTLLSVGALLHPVRAIGSWKAVGQTDFGRAISGEDMNGESSWFTGTQYSLWSFSCMAIGTGCSENVADAGSYISRSAVGQLANVVGATYTTKPADFGLWLADTGTTLGFLPKQAYAQGIGFTGLTPLLPIWKAFRNIAYLLMAVIMIVIGLMIMFRKNIDPKTVVTAQNAIPRVVMALILITFSYAIVGILIDAMYLVLFFVIAIFKSTGYLANVPDPNNAASWVFQYKTPEALYGQGGLLANMSNIEINPYKLFGLNINSGAATVGLTVVGTIMTVIFGIAAGPPGALASGIGFGAFPLIHVILGIAVIFLFIRLAAFFLSSYIQIIISLLFAPVQLLFEAVPGSSAFSSWIKNLVANLAVFPVAAILFMLSAVFSSFSSMSPDVLDTKTIWSPPYVHFFNNMTAISSLVSLGLLFAIPQVAGQIKEMLKAKPAVPMFDMGGAGGSAMQWLSAAYYLRSFIPQQIIDRVTGGNKAGGSESHS